MTRRTLDGMAPAACTTSSAAASTATRSTSAGSCRTSRRCSTTTRCSRPSTCTRRRVLGDERYRAVADADARLRAARARARRRRLRLGAGRRHRRRRGADVHLGAGRGRARRAAAAVRGRPLRPARRARRRDARAAASRSASSGRKPLRDDKAIASWNGLALAALAAGRPARAGDWSTRCAGEFLLGPLSTPDGRLHRTWRDGVAKGTGYLEDYADVANGLIELHVATGEPRWLARGAPARAARGRAVRRRRAAAASSRRRATASSSSRARRSSTTTRRRAATRCSPTCCSGSRGSGATTSSSSAPSRCSGSSRDALARAPSAFGWLLVALDQHLAPHRELAIVGAPDAPVARAALARRRADRRVAFGPADDVPLLAGRTQVDGKPAVYVCERFACALPVTDAAALSS